MGVNVKKTKRCTKCKKEQDISEFNVNKRQKSGLQCWCKKCKSNNRTLNKKEYKIKHTGNKICVRCGNNKKINEFGKNIYNKDGRKNICNDCRHAEYEKNKESICLKAKKYYMVNKYKIGIKNKKYMRNKRKNDLQFMISSNLRRRINRIANGMVKSGSSVRDLGCSISDFIYHIESRFENGMCWENYGTKWHFDHIVPLSFFDLSIREEFLIACNYKNIQPMWAEKNLHKHNSLPDNLYEIIVNIQYNVWGQK